jgi:hypothetical protein
VNPVMLKLMTQNSLLAKSAISFVIFSSLGVFLLAVAGSDFYDWYATGNLWFPSRYDHGSYTTYSKAPGLFVAAFMKNLTLTVAGVVCIVGAFISPSQLRKKEQARLASIQKSSPHPWPSRPKGPG